MSFLWIGSLRLAHLAFLPHLPSVHKESDRLMEGQERARAREEGERLGKLANRYDPLGRGLHLSAYFGPM